MDEKDKIIATLAIGFLLATGMTAALAIAQYQAYGRSPIVQVAEFRVIDFYACDGLVTVTFYLINQGAAGFAYVQIRADDAPILQNSYYVARGDYRLVQEGLFVNDCGARLFSAEIVGAIAA